MTGHDAFDRTLAGWLEAEALSPAPAAGLERVLHATRRRRPRPAWLAGPGSHWVGETPTASSSAGARSLPRSRLQLSAALILLIILALVGGTILVGARLLQPSPLPTGRLGHLAYVRDGGVYLADWDGGNPVWIGGSTSTGDGCDDAFLEGALWSPNGRYLAYRSNLGSGCTPRVFIHDAQGTAIASWAAGVGWNVAWAPDSTRVATWSAVGGIDIRGVDGVLQQQVNLPEGFCLCGDRDPFWAHDGTAILIQMARYDALPSQYWRLPVAGGSPRRLTDSDPAAPCCLAFTASGGRSAFQSDGSLLVTPADDLSVATLAIRAEFGRRMIWSPTGDRLAVTAIRDQVVDRDGNLVSATYHLQLLDTASGQLTTLKTGSEAINPLAFSPEGDRVLFSQDDATGTSSLWSVTTDGSDPRLLVAGADWGDWQWQPASS
jgi:Tol biopolymer transport system component